MLEATCSINRKSTPSKKPSLSVLSFVHSPTVILCAAKHLVSQRYILLPGGNLKVTGNFRTCVQKTITKRALVRSFRLSQTKGRLEHLEDGWRQQHADGQICLRRIDQPFASERWKNYGRIKTEAN